MFAKLSWMVSSQFDIQPVHLMDLGQYMGTESTITCDTNSVVSKDSPGSAAMDTESMCPWILCNTNKRL